MIWLTLFAILVLLVCSAFFSGSETALTAASRARMHTLEEDGSQRASVVNKLISAQERVISAILLGNNLVNILASALATSLFINFFGTAGVFYATVAMTVLVVIFAEVLPKTFAISKPDETALNVAPVLRPIVLLLSPATAAIDWAIKAILALFGREFVSPSELISAHDELRGVISLHHREGNVVKHDRDMLGGVLNLKDLEVSDVMVHRTKIVALNADDPPEDIVEQVLSSPFTRLPLWRGDTDNLVGLVHAKDLLRDIADLD